MINPVWITISMLYWLMPSSTIRWCWPRHSIRRWPGPRHESDDLPEWKDRVEQALGQQDARPHGRQELGRSLFTRRSLAVYLLAALPLSLALLRAGFLPESQRALPAHTTTELAQIFHFFMLRFIVFFSTATLFVKLFRGEILERSLHYQLLAPVRRDVLVIGKYLGGLVWGQVRQNQGYGLRMFLV